MFSANEVRGVGSERTQDLYLQVSCAASVFALLPMTNMTATTATKLILLLMLPLTDATKLIQGGAR